MVLCVPAIQDTPYMPLFFALTTKIFFPYYCSSQLPTMGNKKSKKKTQEDKGDEFGAQWNHADANKKADADAKKQAETSDGKSLDFLTAPFCCFGVSVVLLLHRLRLVNHLPTGVGVSTSLSTKRANFIVTTF
mgnify:CR=1 FL=1